MKTATTKRPILFSAPMVRAILDGRKTQTRRVVKHHLPTGACDVRDIGYGPEIYGAGGVWLPLKCPYGDVGDRLWVRETWMPHFDDDSLGVCIKYRADDGLFKPTTWTENQGFWCESASQCPGIKWTPSIHMPRWASRITLEITGVRVERLQEISEADAQAEGPTKLPVSGRYCTVQGGQYFGDAWNSARKWYQVLWDSINGPGSWDANPWVWVIEFKREEAKA